MESKAGQYKEQNAPVLDAVKEAYRKVNPGKRLPNIGLPNNVCFTLAEGVCKIYLGARQVTQNMQSNDAAFDGWALALHAFLGCGVELSWEQPLDLGDLHYQRFLYRVIHMKPEEDWFKVSIECTEFLSGSLVLNSDETSKEKLGHHVVNVAIDEREESQGVGPGPLNQLDELQIELLFLNDQQARAALAASAGLSSNPKITRKIPVGLFSENLSNKTRVFTGGKSMIDFVAIDDNETVALFELKKVGVEMVGAISELLFYSHFIRDIQRGILGYQGEVDEVTGRVFRSDSVQAFILADTLHPLHDNEKVFETLNEAYSDSNQEFGFIKYEETPDSVKFTREYFPVI